MTGDVGQLELDVNPSPVWARTGPAALWWEFHQSHPEVAEALVSLARPLLYQGQRRLSIAMLWETLRYQTCLGATTEEGPWRLNNTHRAYYARWLMESHPDLGGMFETRHGRWV